MRYYSDIRFQFEVSEMQQSEPVLVSTTERPAGYEVERTLGQVFGVVVRSRGLGVNIVTYFRAWEAARSANTPAWWRTPAVTRSTA